MAEENVDRQERDVEVVKVTPGHESGEVTQSIPQARSSASEHITPPLMEEQNVQVVKVTPGHESGEVTQPTPQRGDDHWQAEQAELAAGSRRDRGSTTKQQAVYDPESELRYAHIGCMDCYMNRSSEELRWEDYQDGVGKLNRWRKPSAVRSPPGRGAQSFGRQGFRSRRHSCSETAYLAQFSRRMVSSLSRDGVRPLRESVVLAARRLGGRCCSSPWGPLLLVVLGASAARRRVFTAFAGAFNGTDSSGNTTESTHLLL